MSCKKRKGITRARTTSCKVGLGKHKTNCMGHDFGWQKTIGFYILGNIWEDIIYQKLYFHFLSNLNIFVLDNVNNGYGHEYQLPFEIIKIILQYEQSIVALINTDDDKDDEDDNDENDDDTVSTKKDLNVDTSPKKKNVNQCKFDTFGPFLYYFPKIYIWCLDEMNKYMIGYVPSGREIPANVFTFQVWHDYLNKSKKFVERKDVSAQLDVASLCKLISPQIA